MATDPFRLRVLKALTDQIKTVSPANGYTQDLSDYTDSAGRPAQHVFRGRDRFGDSDPLPLVSILEDFRAQEQKHAPAETGRSARGAQTGEWKLLIQGFVPDDKENPLDPAYHLGAEVIVALVKSKERYNILGLGHDAPCVTDLKIGQLIARPADGEVSDVAYFFLSVTLTLVEDLERPFAP